MGVEALRGDRGRGAVQFLEPVERGVGRSGRRVVVEPGEFVAARRGRRRSVAGPDVPDGRGWAGCLAVVLDEGLERAANGGVVRGGRGGVAAGCSRLGLAGCGLLGSDLVGCDRLAVSVLG